jgi:transcriptional regulator of acetoin/glycerol metabolism
LADHLELPVSILAYIEKLDAATPSERDRLVQALVACDWNRTRAAESLQWSRMTVHRKIRQYGIVADQNRRALA